MSIFETYSVWCDNRCGREDGLKCYDKDGTEEAAAKQGWHARFIDKDNLHFCCQECLNEGLAKLYHDWRREEETIKGYKCIGAGRNRRLDVLASLTNDYEKDNFNE